MTKAVSIILTLALVMGICLSGCQTKTSESQATADSATADNAKNTSAEYAESLFDTGYVHEINVEISEDDWKDLLENPLEKTKYKANVTIDGNRVENVSFATKGNTSLSQVASSDSDRYSFKINFGKYEKGQTYQGLDKLNLNNIMSDATYMKDYLSYMIMREAGVSAPLTSYAALSINGELHGLYIAIENVSDSFLERNGQRRSAMDVFEILNDKSIRKLEARKLIADSISDGSFSLTDFSGRAEQLNDKQTATFLEAIESVTGQKDSRLGVEYLKFAEKYILSDNNSCKREASRIVGNMAHLYPDELGVAIEALLKNTSVSGTVVRWGSAYALARIIVLERYRNSDLVNTVRDIYEAEQENGVRNQYAKALKRIKAI